MDILHYIHNRAVQDSPWDRRGVTDDEVYKWFSIPNNVSIVENALVQMPEDKLSRIIFG